MFLELQTLSCFHASVQRRGSVVEGANANDVIGMRAHVSSINGPVVEGCILAGQAAPTCCRLETSSQTIAAPPTLPNS